MSNFRRRRPKDRKAPSWSHKPELDPEPDPSKSGPVRKKKKKRDWVITGNARSFWRKRRSLEKRSVYGRYETKERAEQALKAMQRQQDERKRRFPKWPDYDYRVEYVGKEKTPRKD